MSEVLFQTQAAVSLCLLPHSPITSHCPTAKITSALISAEYIIKSNLKQCQPDQLCIHRRGMRISSQSLELKFLHNRSIIQTESYLNCSAIQKYCLFGDRKINCMLCNNRNKSKTVTSLGKFPLAVPSAAPKATKR